MKISKSLCKYPDTVIICDVEQRGESLTELKAWLTQAHIHKRKCLKTAFVKLLLKMLLSPRTPSLQHSVVCCSGMACPVYYLPCFYLRQCLITLDFLIQSKLQQPCGHFRERLSPRHRYWTRSVILSPFSKSLQIFRSRGLPESSMRMDGADSFSSLGPARPSCSSLAARRGWKVAHTGHLRFSSTWKTQWHYVVTSSELKNQ